MTLQVFKLHERGLLARGIDRERRMHPGTRGFAGGAIYFSRDPWAACRKCQHGRGHAEVIIECAVSLGTCKVATKNSVTMRNAVRQGFDSVMVASLDVYAVLDSSRVQILRFQQVGGVEWFWSMEELRDYYEPRPKDKDVPPSSSFGWMALLGGLCVLAFILVKR